MERTQDYKGTQLQGYLHVTYQTLVEKLGKAHVKGSINDKSRVFWAFKLSDGTVFTIYDYKTSQPLSTIDRWNIGGNSRGSLEAVGNIFPRSEVKQRHIPKMIQF